MQQYLGWSAGISAVTTLLERRAQVHQSELVSHLAPGGQNFQLQFRELRNAFGQYFGPFESLRKGSGVIYNELLRQSTLMAFIDSFRMLSIVSILCVGAVILLKRVKGKRVGGVH